VARQNLGEGFVERYYLTRVQLGKRMQLAGT
jgi:hypothetical protein